MIIRTWLLLVLSACAAQPLNLELQMPDSEIFDVTRQTIFQNAYNGDQFTFVFEDSNFEFSSEVYERSESIKTDLSDDFDGDKGRLKQLYKVSERCHLERTHITFDKTSQTPTFKKGINAFIYDSSDSVYIFSNNTIVLFFAQLNEGNVILVQNTRKQLDLSHSLKIEQAAFVNLGNHIFLTDGNKFLFVKRNHDKFGVSSLQIISVNFPGSVSQNGEFIKMLHLDENSFIGLWTDSVVKYSITEYIDVSEAPNGIPKSLNNQLDSLTDVIADQKNVYILDENKLVVLNRSNMTQYNVHELNLGICTRIEKVEDTLEIICDYRRNVYVAEIMIIDSELRLNRFYSHIDKIQDIDFYNGKGFFIGQHQILILSHSVNRNSMAGIKEQHMKTYASFGIHSFEVMIRHSTTSTAVLIGISNEKAIIIKMQELPVSLHCDFTDAGITTKTLMVEINTTFCGSIDWKEWHSQHKENDVFCRIRIPFVFNIGLALEKKSQNIIIMSVVVIIISLMLIIIGAAARWGTEMQDIMRHMSMQIARKQGENTSKHIVTSQANMLRNIGQ